MSAGSSPARRLAPTTEPADVPTISSAPAGIPAELVGEGVEHADVEGVADDAAGPEDQGDARVGGRDVTLSSLRRRGASSLAAEQDLQ